VAVFQRGRNWYLDYYIGPRRIRECVGPSKGAALRALSIRKAEIALGKFGLIPKADVPTFEMFADRYLELVSYHKRGYKNERYVINALKHVFRHRKLSDMTPEDAERFKTTRSGGVKPATVNRELTVLKAMLSQAKEWELIPINPFREVRFLRAPKQIECVLEMDEGKRLAAGCNRVRSPFLRHFVLLALNTGMMRSELLSLQQWPHVDLIGRTIRVINAKSSSGERDIPMNETAYVLFHDLAVEHSSCLIFTSNRKPGKRFVDLKKAFKKTLQLAGIAHIRVHDLRQHVRHETRAGWGGSDYCAASARPC
jgi:integrase